MKNKKELSKQLEKELKEDILASCFNMDYFNPEILEKFKDENNLSEQDMNELLDDIIKGN